jgi:hypothetical protein
MLGTIAPARLSAILALLALAPACCLGAEPMRFTTFDLPPGPVGGQVYPLINGLNDLGVIVGTYEDVNQVYHGFIRTSDGKFQTYNDPDAGTTTTSHVVGTYMTGINDAGEIAGYYINAQGDSYGFVLRRDGTGKASYFPGTADAKTFPVAINSLGALTGNYYTGLGPYPVYQGFVRTPDGIFTTFQVPGAYTGKYGGTTPVGIDLFGTVAGNYVTATGNPAFLRYSNGVFETTLVPGAINAYIRGVNELGTTIGDYTNAQSVPHSFMRTAFGTLTNIDVAKPGPGSIATPLAINLWDTVIGSYYDAGNVSHGYIRAANGRVTTFDVPGAGAGATQGTYPTAINAFGQIAGSYTDSNNRFHGFLLTMW